MMLAPLGLALLIAVAVPQGASALPSFDFKGIKATDKFALRQALFSKCSKYFNFEGCKFTDTQVGGKLVFPEAGWASDGSLVLIRGDIYGSDYSVIREAFINKWGAPSSRNQIPVQNGYGAQAAIAVDVWKFAEGEMTLTGPALSTDARFEFQSYARKAYMEDLNKPKNDF